MRSHDLRGGAGRWRRLTIASLVCSLAAAFAIWLAPTATQDAVADGETRTLHLYHTHSKETIDATFRVDGHYDASVLRELNHFLRDWRNDDETNMDPRLFDAIWEAYRTAGATDRIQIYSAYRSPETNAMLRRRSKAVAEHSQHMLGKAMDTTMPGFPMSRIREAGMKLQHGGVGWYPSANFVHLDVGGVRSWPRMSYEQLAELYIKQERPKAAPQPAPQVQVAFQAPQPEALAYAPATPQAQPLDGQTPIAGTAGLTGQPLSAAPQQVASLEPAGAAAVDNEDAVMPLPPRRPADLAVAETPNVPLPPVRPVALNVVDTPLRAAQPAVPPPTALAFAALETPAATAAVDPLDLRPAPRVVRKAEDLATALKPLALRAGRSRTIVAASSPPPEPVGTLPPASTSMPAGGLTGLRRAAHRIAENAAL